MKAAIKFAVIACLLLAARAGFAHIVLAEPAAPAGTSYRATFRVGHGCDGSATTAIKVFIPDGFRGAKPMPKPGWILSTRREKLAQPYDSHGKTITDDVVEVTWTAAGRDHGLPDAWYDEFILRGSLPADEGPRWFRVLQTCEHGQLDWAQIPPSGTSTRGLKTPAVLLEVQPAEAAHRH